MLDWRVLASGGLWVLGTALVLAGFSWAWAWKDARRGLIQALGLVLICAGMGLGSEESWRQVLWGVTGVFSLGLAVYEARKIRS